MYNISEKTLEKLRADYPVGARVERLCIDDPYNKKLHPGSRGTVKFVDDMGTIHVRWDCGSSLGVVYDEDSCRVIEGDE